LVREFMSGTTMLGLARKYAMTWRAVQERIRWWMNEHLGP